MLIFMKMLMSTLYVYMIVYCCNVYVDGHQQAPIFYSASSIIISRINYNNQKN